MIKSRNSFNHNILFSMTNAFSWKEQQSNDELVQDVMNLYEIGRFLEFNFFLGAGFVGFINITFYPHNKVR